MFDEMKEKLTAAGYKINDEYDIDTMQYLERRILKHSDEETVLYEFARQQMLKLQEEDETALCMGNTTLFTTEVEDVAAMNQTIMSADSTLGKERSDVVRKWVMEGVLLDTQQTDEELFIGLMQSEYANKYSWYDVEASVRRYIALLRPLYTEVRKQEDDRIYRRNKSRANLAHNLVQVERDNLTGILEKERHVLIRQVIDTGDGEFWTICPVCGKRTKLVGPAIRIMAYPTERGVRKKIFSGFMGCETSGCDTALMFSPNEYVAMGKDYLKLCAKSIDAFVDSTKRICPSASVLHTALPVSAVKDSIDSIVIYESLIAPVINENEDGRVTIFVNDNEMLKAAERFYFKLQGARKITGSTKDESGVMAQENETGVQDGGEGYRTASAGQAGAWTYHDVAVLTAQCLSKDYYLERNKALFSLILFVKSNPLLESTIMRGDAWNLETLIIFLRRYVARENPRSLSEAEVVSIRSTLARAGIATEDEPEKLLKVAVNEIAELEHRLAEKETEYEARLHDLMRFEDELAYTKITRVNSCNVSDLEQLLATEESTRFFYRVADRMIINSYAGDFCNYWTALGIMRARRVQNICSERTDMNSVEKSLQDLENEGWYTQKTYQKMIPIFKRNSELIEKLQRLQKCYLEADYYNFCKVVYTLDPFEFPLGQQGDELKKLLYDFYDEARVVAGKSKAQVYLAEDFSDAEILGCSKCDEIVFGRYVLKRQAGESINDYCERYFSWDGSVNENNVHDNFEKFRPLNKYGVVLSVCANLYNAEFESFGKSIFMSALLCDPCYEKDPSWKLKKNLGVSLMQQNIIKTVEVSQVKIRNPGGFYRMVNGIYLTSAEEGIDKLRDVYESMTIRTSASADDIEKALDFCACVKEMYEELEMKTDEDGELLQDSLEALDEIAGYAGDTVKRIMGWERNDLCIA